MRKIKVIYSLTNRGLYSELFNLALARVYAESFKMVLVIDTRYWNVKIHKGWSDFFESTIECHNDFFSAQLVPYDTDKPWIGKIYYAPKIFFSYYITSIKSEIFKFFHPHTLLSRDVFGKMRSKNFLNSLGGDCFEQMRASFLALYQPNANVKKQIYEKKKLIGLPDKYIGVHIRRGDKITAKEMQFISLDKYIKLIFELKTISKNIYVATDDVSVIDYLRNKLSLGGFTLFYNNMNTKRGFNENDFNKSSHQEIYHDTLNVMLDMDILIHSCYFVGTYTSNLSRIVPFYIGLNRCTSLDIKWDVLGS